MTVPATLNGYPVLYSATNGEYAIVLVLREGHPVHPFVVAYWTERFGGNEWGGGDYRETLPEALATFQKRSRQIGIPVEAKLTTGEME